MAKYKISRAEEEFMNNLRGARLCAINNFIKVYQRPGLFDKRTYEDGLDELVTAHLEYKKYKDDALTA